MEIYEIVIITKIKSAYDHCCTAWSVHEAFLTHYIIYTVKQLDITGTGAKVRCVPRNS